MSDLIPYAIAMFCGVVLVTGFAHAAAEMNHRLRDLKHEQEWMTDEVMRWRVRPHEAATMPDLDLLSKLASGEGGARTGVLIREGLIEVRVTDKGREFLRRAGRGGVA